MVAFDALEQLHATALQPEHADAITHLRPFFIQVGFNEVVREWPNMEASGFGMTPVQRPAIRQSYRAGEKHRLPGEKAQMFGSVLPVLGLVEWTSIDTDD